MEYVGSHDSFEMLCKSVIILPNTIMNLNVVQLFTTFGPLLAIFQLVNMCFHVEKYVQNCTQVHLYSSVTKIILITTNIRILKDTENLLKATINTCYQKYKRVTTIIMPRCVIITVIKQ